MPPLGPTCRRDPDQRVGCKRCPDLSRRGLTRVRAAAEVGVHGMHALGWQPDTAVRGTPRRRLQLRRRQLRRLQPPVLAPGLHRRLCVLLLLLLLLHAPCVQQDVQHSWNRQPRLNAKVMRHLEQGGREEGLGEVCIRRGDGGGSGGGGPRSCLRVQT